MVSYRPAAALAFPDLLALWNAAYAGYLVPLVFDEAMLGRHIRRSGLDLERSLAGFEDGVPFGLSLAAFRRDRAWIGGFGIAESHRRRGLATTLMQAHLERLVTGGTAQAWLEVIDRNPAREVYRRCGFAETRVLAMHEGRPQAGEAGETLDVAELAARHAAFNPVRSTWRRDLPTLLDSIERDGAVMVGTADAYAVAGVQGERLFVFDAAASDFAAARRLLGALAARWPGMVVRLVDEPDDSPVSRACRAAGFSNPLNQVEMMRPLSET